MSNEILKKFTPGMLINRVLRFLGLVIFRARSGYHYVPNIYGRSAVKLRDIRENALFRRVAEEVMREGRTKHYYDRLYHLFQAVENTARLVSPDQIIRVMEVGAWKGGTSYFIASLLEKLSGGKAVMHSIDTFEGHSTKDLPQGREGKRHVPGLFSDTSFEDVKAHLSRFPFVQVLKGRIQDLAPDLPRGPFHLVHLDMDIAEPTKFSLDFFGSRMAPGGIILVDDYGFFETSPGIEIAVEEYVKKNQPGRVRRVNLMTGQCLLLF